MTQGFFGFLFSQKSHIWVDSIKSLWQIECCKDFLCQFIVAYSINPGITDRTIEGRADETDFDEVVEMSGLQRGILTVVGEAEKFSCF